MPQQLSQTNETHVRKTEAQSVQTDASVFVYLKRERTAVVRAMHQHEHKFPTLLKRLIRISSLQLGDLTRLTQSHIGIIIEVVQVVQQYLGKVEVETGTKEATPKQRLLVEAGTLELLVRLVCWEHLPRHYLLEILDLACSIVAVAGGYEEAQRRVHQFLRESASQSFFLFMERQFKLSAEKMRALHSSQHKRNTAAARTALAVSVFDVENDNPATRVESKNSEMTNFDSEISEVDTSGAVASPKSRSRYDRKLAEDPGNRKLLRFWQWLCEGNNKPNQELLRAQPHNSRSINLLTLAVTLLSDVAERNLGQPESLRVAISLYDVLCESVQGACSSNQRCLALDTDLLDTSNSILQHLNGGCSACICMCMRA